MSTSDNREIKKNELKRRMISSDSNIDEGEIENKKRNENNKVGRLIITLFIIGLILWGIFQIFNRTYKFSTYSLLEEKAISEGSFIGYETFNDKLIKYSQDGIILLDINGKEEWIESYEMKSPIVETSKNHIAVADQSGNIIEVFGKNGKESSINTILPISKLTVSDNGIIAVIVEDAISSYINFFTYDGKNLDITIKSNLTGDGYPTSISLSPNGTQLIVSFQYIDNGILRGRVVFYDFSEIGKNIPNRLVGGFDEPFDNALMGRAKFINEVNSFAVGSTGLYFFSSKNIASPELIKSVGNEEEIHSIDYNDKYIAVVFENRQGENKYRLELYRPNGKLITKKNFNIDFDRFALGKKYIYLYSGDNLSIYNLSGTLKYSGQVPINIEFIEESGLFYKFNIIGSSRINVIRLK